MTNKEEFEALLPTADKSLMTQAEENSAMDAQDVGFEVDSERYYRAVINNYEDLRDGC